MNVRSFLRRILFLRRIKIFILDPVRVVLLPPRSLNFHVYREIKRKRLSRPDIRVRTPEQYSQHGEDVIVSGVLRAFAVKNDVDLSKLFFCEIGANHPIATSNTYLLAKALNMRGLLVEANPHLIPELVRTRPESIVVNLAVTDQDLGEVSFYLSNQSEISSLSQRHVRNWYGGAVGEAKMIRCPSIRYNDLIERYLNGARPVFVSIDIEGHDSKVLRDMNLESYGPLLLQLEVFGSDSELAKNMMDHLKLQGYSLLAKTDVNLIFLKSDASPWMSALPPTDVLHHTAARRDANEQC
jgi:FkbM family methyltransferase